MINRFALIVPLLFTTAAPGAPNELPRSRAERSNFTETSRYAEVIDFIAVLQQRDPALRVETFAQTNEGRNLPLVILSRPAVATPAEALRSGKPIVFVMANIHAGEVEGKEAALHIMREVVTGSLGGLLDRMIILVAPIYNADGNERININNRSAQNGPTEGVGVRENAQGLDLNRDFMKVETPEARGLIGRILNRWDPHVVIDLHTTNGSHHGYALTYAPCLNPNSDSRLTSFLRNQLFPSVTRSMKLKHGYNVYYYGNFADPANPLGRPPAEGAERAWATFDHRPRFGNNYIGLRNRLAILSEAYSYLDFKSRVDATEKFVIEILRYVAARATEVIRLTSQADASSRQTALTAGNEEGFGISFEPKRSERPVPILVGSVNRTIDPRNNRPRFEATRDTKPERMYEFGRFAATRRLKPPAAYVLGPDQQRIVDVLLAHGITVERSAREVELDVIAYNVGEVRKAPRAFQGHTEARLTVTTSQTRRHFPAGSFVVTMHQPKAALVFYLLEPESDDGLANWNFFDDEIERTRLYPVFRLANQPKVPREIL